MFCGQQQATPTLKGEEAQGSAIPRGKGAGRWPRSDSSCKNLKWLWQSSAKDPGQQVWGHTAVATGAPARLDTAFLEDEAGTPPASSTGTLARTRVASVSPGVPVIVKAVSGRRESCAHVAESF